MFSIVFERNDHNPTVDTFSKCPECILQDFPTKISHYFIAMHLRSYYFLDEYSTVSNIHGSLYLVSVMKYFRTYTDDCLVAALSRLNEFVVKI